MSNKSITWTSFRTLEPNPDPYTPMTQSILDRGIRKSSLISAVQQDTPITAFHRGYLYFNVPEILRILDYFFNIPLDVVVQYFTDDPDVDLSQISLRPSLAGLIFVAKTQMLSGHLFLRGMTAEYWLPDCPPVGDQRDRELRKLMILHQDYLTKLISAHVLFSALAEAYAVGVERVVPNGPSRLQIQDLISSWTNSKTSEMARRASNLHSESQRKTFLKDFGHRCPREMEIAVPRWRDDPNTLPETSSQSEELSHSDDTADGLSTTLARVALFPGSLLERLRENPKNEWLKSYAYLRDVLIEIGHRSTKSGHLNTPEDIFYVSQETASQLLEEPPSRRYVRQAVAQERTQYDANIAYTPPLFTDDEFQPIEHQDTTGESETLQGLGVSTGTVNGRAITAQSPGEVDISRDSESKILVTEFTDAGWTPIFFQIDGLVMERGSMLSHGSIVAREAGIPAVVNVDGALEEIESGTNIEINADDGSVRCTDS